LDAVEQPTLLILNGKTFAGIEKRDCVKEPVKADKEVVPGFVVVINRRPPE